MGQSSANKFAPYQGVVTSLLEGLFRSGKMSDFFSGKEDKPKNDTFNVVKGMQNAFDPEDLGGSNRSYGLETTDPYTPITPRTPTTSRPNAPNFVHDAFNKYRDAIESQPKRSDYNPTKMRVLLSGLASAGVGYGTKDVGNAYNVMNDLMKSPYQNAAADWTAKTNHLKGLADAESVNNRELWDQYYQSEALASTNANRATIDQNADLTRQLNERKVKIAEGLSELRRSVLSNSGRIIIDKNGQAVLFPDVGPPRMYPKEVFEAMTFEERQKMIQDDRMEIINDDQKFDERMETMRQRNRIALKETPSADSTEVKTDPGFSPGETNQEMRNRMNLWRQYHTDQSDWIDDKTGMMTLPGRSLFGGPSVEEQETAKKNYLSFLSTGVDPTGAVQGSTTPQKPDRTIRSGATAPPGTVNPRTPGPRVAPPGVTRAPRHTQGAQTPPINERQVGDTHTFLGGRTATWDGQGWDTGN